MPGKLRDALDNLLPDHGEDEGYLLHRGDLLRDAAVLIAFTDRPDPGVILTQRPQWLRSHAGQVAFPGGKIDPGDADAVDAVLREAEEESARTAAMSRSPGRPTPIVQAAAITSPRSSASSCPTCRSIPIPTRSRTGSKCRSTSCSIPPLRTPAGALARAGAPL